MPMMKETMLKRLLLPIAAAGGGGSAPVQDTATGNPLVFFTDLARPLKSLLIPFTPVQSGTGDPSPQNIRSILPWNGLKVWNGSGNLCGADIEQGEYNYTYGNKQDGETRIRSDYIPISAGTYTISCTGMQNVVVYVFDKNKSVIIAESTRIWKIMPFTFTVSGDRYIAFAWRKTSDQQITPSDISNVMLNIGNTAQSYVPYKPITETDISFPSPVYGGEHEAVSGKLMDGWKVETLDDSDAWTEGGTFISYSYHAFTDRKVGDSFIGVCSALPIKNNVPSGTAYMRWGGTDAPNILIAPNGSGLTFEDVKTLSGQGKIVLAYPLATPQEIKLTPEQITALVGDNTIWSDADGEMTATYLKKAE